MTAVLAYPSVLDVRRTIELHILQLYEADGTTLKAYTSWPGYYTLPTNARVPAVYVVGQTMVPSNWKVTGIETTIEDVPEIVVPDASASGLVSYERWNVRFTNYGAAQGTTMPVTLLDIRRRLARAFPRDQVMYMPRTEASFEAITAQVTGAVLTPPLP
jgi:hypothetical protein